jgi:hypothetical protein
LLPFLVGRAMRKLRERERGTNRGEKLLQSRLVA